jgi:Activator of Hsp90 ATPase homolog 1-like protein
MYIAEGSLNLAVDANDLYEYLVDPTHVEALLSSDIAELEDIQPLPGGGYTYRCVYHWQKFPIWAQGATTMLIPGKRIVLESMGGIDMIASWLFEPDDGQTRVTVAFEVPSTGLLLKRLSPRVVTRQLRVSVDAALANVQAISRTLAAQPGGQLVAAA